MHILERVFHALINNVSFSSATDVESPNPGPVSSLTLVPFYPPSLGPSVLAGTSSRVHSPLGLSLLADTSPDV